MDPHWEAIGTHIGTHGVQLPLEGGPYGPLWNTLMTQKKIVFFWLKIFFTLTNSVNPDEMQHTAAFHLGLHCLQMYSFRGSPNIKG